MKIKSPCTLKCHLDRVNNICTGCLRTTDEIAHWRNMTEEEKQLVIERLQLIKNIILLINLK